MLEKAFRIALFLIKNSVREPAYTIKYIIHFFAKDFSQSVSFLTKEALVESIRNGKSLIRLGDGEAYIFYHGSIPGNQTFNKELRDHFSRLIHEYTEDSPYLIGVATYLTQTNEELRTKKLLRTWLPFKIWYQSQFNKKTPYFDAHLFYRTGAFQKTLTNILRENNILIVTNKKSIEYIKQTPLEKTFSIQYLEIPESNANDHYQTIYETILNTVKESGQSWRVLLSAGPTSKALAFNLSKEHVICYDIGLGIHAIYGKSDLEKVLY